MEDSDLIVMGDFNTPSLDDKTFKALTRRGLQIPDALVDLTTVPQLRGIKMDGTGATIGAATAG